MQFVDPLNHNALEVSVLGDALGVERLAGIRLVRDVPLCLLLGPRPLSLTHRHTHMHTQEYLTNQRNLARVSVDMASSPIGRGTSPYIWHDVRLGDISTNRAFTTDTDCVRKKLYVIFMRMCKEHSVSLTGMKQVCLDCTLCALDPVHRFSASASELVERSARLG